MGELIVARPSVLSDSNFKSRPGFRTILMTDANGRGTAVKQIEDKRQKRLMKFPSLIGRQEVESLLTPQVQHILLPHWICYLVNNDNKNDVT